MSAVPTVSPTSVVDVFVSYTAGGESLAESVRSLCSDAGFNVFAHQAESVALDLLPDDLRLQAILESHAVAFVFGEDCSESAPATMLLEAGAAWVWEKPLFGIRNHAQSPRPTSIPGATWLGPDDLHELIRSLVAERAALSEPHALNLIEVYREAGLPLVNLTHDHATRLKLASQFHDATGCDLSPQRLACELVRRQKLGELDPSR